MNIKDLIVYLMLALGITLVFQYLFLGKNEEKKAIAERVRIMPKTDVYRIPEIEIDFWDQELNIKPVTTQIDTDFAQYSFSNEGAALIKADFKHTSSGKTILLPGIKSAGREDRSFLVAFNKKTPYYFELVNHKVLDGVTKLEYKARFDGGYLTKIFTVYQNKPQLDLQILFEPNANLVDSYRLRLVYSIPSILNAASSEEVQQLQMREDYLLGIIDVAGKVVKKPVLELQDRYWEDPINFGGLDKYLVVTTVGNQSSFAQRGYYNLYSNNLLRAYLESPEINDQTEWNLSFYLGPKQDKAFALVDANLDQLLDFGFLAPLSKLFLRLLNWLYSFVGNFGWAIVLLTMLIKLVTLPLSWSFEKSTKKMQEVSRKSDYLQQKYKNDPEAFARARAELIQKQGMSSFGGCLVPFILQMTVFFAFRNILINSVELYMSPFLWINNLVAADPYCILPLLFATLMFVKMSANSDARKKINALGGAIFTGSLLSFFSAGLLLYLVVNTLLELLQTQVYNKYGRA